MLNRGYYLPYCWVTWLKSALSVEYQVDINLHILRVTVPGWRQPFLWITWLTLALLLNIRPVAIVTWFRSALLLDVSAIADEHKLYRWSTWLTSAPCFRRTATAFLFSSWTALQILQSKDKIFTIELHCQLHSLFYVVGENSKPWVGQQWLRNCHFLLWDCIQRETWCMGPYTRADYNLNLCRLQHIYHGWATLCQSRPSPYPPLRD